jgi:hypothetical protein
MLADLDKKFNPPATLFFYRVPSCRPLFYYLTQGSYDVILALLCGTF